MGPWRSAEGSAHLPAVRSFRRIFKTKLIEPAPTAETVACRPTRRRIADPS
jgi:hypothetical protein